jgi:DtxR family Mn-dependent transcriptional regulator
MGDNMSRAIEDYLKVIYALAAEHGRASTNEIAERMGVKPGSVTGMLQKMAASEPPLVKYEKHHGVCLTEEGENAALEVIRHHRLLEQFLHQTLGYAWDEVHVEADRLEHVISEDLEERIAQSLGNPSHDPHGDPIPTRDFRMPEGSNTRLSELRHGERARVQRVDNSDPDLLRYLGSLGLTPGAEISVLDYSSFDENLRLRVAGREEPVVVGARISRQIFVEAL